MANSCSRESAFTCSENATKPSSLEADSARFICSEPMPIDPNLPPGYCLAFAKRMAFQYTYMPENQENQPVPIDAESQCSPPDHFSSRQPEARSDQQYVKLAKVGSETPVGWMVRPTAGN